MARRRVDWHPHQDYDVLSLSFSAIFIFMTTKQQVAIPLGE
jgi:hypothetical protein